MTPITMTPEHYTITRTASEWYAIARDHLAAIGDGGFTPAQDYLLMEGLAMGYGIDAVAASIGVNPAVANQRFRAMRIGMIVTYINRQIFQLDAQEALVRALRARLN